MSRPIGNRRFAATYYFDAANVHVPTPSPMSRPSTSSGTRPEPPQILSPCRPTTSQSQRQRPMPRQRSHERMLSSSLQGSSQLLRRPETARDSSPPHEEQDQETPRQQSHIDQSHGALDMISDPNQKLATRGSSPPPPETGELPGNVERWELCSPPPRTSKLRLLGAETLGWGSSRMVVVLLAESGNAHITLRTYNVKASSWVEAPEVQGELAPRVRFRAATCACRPLDDLTSTAHYRRAARLLMYGGEDANQTLSDEMSCLTLIESIPDQELELCWTRVRLDARSARPSPRADHTMCASGGAAYVHGGRLAEGALCGQLYKVEFRGDANELSIMWSLQNADFMSTTAAGRSACPRPRCKHSMSCMSDKLMVFGGEGQTLKDSLELGKELFAYDLESCEWTELSIARPGSKRQGTLRSDHASCVCGPLLVLAGGKSCGYTAEARHGKADIGLRLYDCRDQLPAYADASMADAACRTDIRPDLS
jgi:hypothetical protein